MMKVRIEMNVPGNFDLSTLLEQMQEFAVDLAEEYAEESDYNADDGEEIEVDRAAIEDSVSVQIVPDSDQAA